MDVLLAILHPTAFLVAVLAVIFAGYSARDVLARRRGHKLHHAITVADNPAAAVDLCGFLLGLVLGLLGSLTFRGDTLLEHALELLATAGLVLLALLGNDWVTSRLMYRGLDPHREIYDEGNVALAVARAGGALATGLVVRSALGHDSALLDRVAWVLIGQVALLGISLLYQRFTPYDDLAELQRKNLAAGLPLGGLLLAVGLVVESTLQGESEGWAADLQSVAVDLGLALLLLYVLRWLTEQLVLPGAKLKDEIVRDRNPGAGLVEATSFVVGAVLIGYFLG